MDSWYKGVDIFYAGLGGGGDFGGARFFSAWIWGGTISLEKVLGGHDFLLTIAIQKKLYHILHLSLLWYHLLAIRIFYFVPRFPDSPNHVRFRG